MNRSIIPKICTSIGASTIENLLEKKELALQLGTDLIEIRIDYLNKIDVAEIEKIVKTNPNKFVLTYKFDQGGDFRGKIRDKEKIIIKLAECEPGFLDVDLSFVGGNSNLIKSIKKLGPKIIISWHDFNITPKFKTLYNVLKKAKRYGDIVKIVTMSSNLSDNSLLLELYKFTDTRLIAFCMGEKGILSRVLCPFFGAPFTYASLPNLPTAPSQLNITELKSLYQVIKFEY